jgi:hypothetical protein
MRGPKRGPTSVLVVKLTAQQRLELEHWQRCSTMAAGLVRRAKAILALAQGASVTVAAQAGQMQCKHVRKWVRRLGQQGLAGLHDKDGRGRKPVFSPRGGVAHGEDRLRIARRAGPIAVAVG